MRKREDLPVWKGLLAVQRAGIVGTTVGVTGIVAGACLLRAFKVNFFGFEEILVMVAFWMYMLGCAYGSFEKSHITANMIEVAMKDGRLKDVLTVIKDVVTVALCAVFTVWAIRFCAESLAAGPRMPLTPVYRIPMAVGYLSMAIGLGFSLLYFICYAYDSIRKLARGGSGEGAAA